jgi:hypothetical protein
MTDAFVGDVRARLASLGVRGKALERVLAEVRDHLDDARSAGDSDPAASFGDPKEFARLVASQIATASTRRAALGTFGVLSVVGIAYTSIFALVPAAGGWVDIFGGHVQALGPVLGIASVVFPQIAFVSGFLALLQALRIRRSDVVGRDELALLRRRSNVALAAGAGALASLAGFALDFEGTMAGWWTWATLATTAVLLMPLATASYRVSDSACPAAAPGGPAGSVFDDLAIVFASEPVARLRLPEHPWLFATICAVGVGGAAFLAGWYAEGDPGSGLVRGGFEAIALVVCFAGLGRLLGLRRSD